MNKIKIYKKETDLYLELLYNSLGILENESINSVIISFLEVVV